MNKVIKQLVSAKSEIRGPTLITYIIPANYDLSVIQKHLSREITIMGNEKPKKGDVKPKHIRKSVTSTLKLIISAVGSHCKNGKTPEKGMVILAGAIKNLNHPTMKDIAEFYVRDHLIFEPPSPITKMLYKYDSRFYIDEIVELYEDHPKYGVVYVNSKECIFYELCFGTFKCIDNFPIKNGHRIISEKTINLFYDKINNTSKVSMVIFCGSPQFKKDILSNSLKYFNVEYLTMDVLKKNKVVEFIKDKSNNDNESNTYLQKLIEMVDNRLVFGNDIPTQLERCQIAQLYIHKSKLSMIENLDFTPEIIKLSTNFILEYGGMIGIAWF